LAVASTKSDTYWRKRCRCGAEYTALQWLGLPFVGRLDDDEDDLELRNCTDCGSTISIPTRLVDHVTKPRQA
jgi:hypothetical protein